jgi:hypothetical protein
MGITLLPMGPNLFLPSFREKITGMIELRCSRDLAVRLVAIWPETNAHHRQLRDDAGYMLVRDRDTGWAMFWRWELTREQDGGGAEITHRRASLAQRDPINLRMATNPKPPPTAKRNISPASNRLTPAAIGELCEYHRQADIKIRDALAAEPRRIAGRFWPGAGAALSAMSDDGGIADIEIAGGHFCS